MITDKDLQRIHKFFYRNPLKEKLIEDSELERVTVNAVLRGRHKNQKVIDTALTIIESERKKSKLRVQSALK